jgi:group I intron endonuclease
MSCGIYALYWENQDLVYVGQSQNIEARFKEHLNLIRKRKHTNYRVQDTYNLYGEPILVIIEICDISQSNFLEILWTKEFDSINTGLNITEAGLVGHGHNSNYNKYSKLQVLGVFRYLYLNRYVARKDIASILKVEESLIVDIATGASHLWLKHKYPKSYAKMQRLRKEKQIAACCIRPKLIIDPNGIEHIVFNIKQFALDNNLQRTHLSSVLSGSRNSHKGWKLK